MKMVYFYKVKCHYLLAMNRKSSMHSVFGLPRLFSSLCAVLYAYDPPCSSRQPLFNVVSLSIQDLYFNYRTYTLNVRALLVRWYAARWCKGTTLQKHRVLNHQKFIDSQNYSPHTPFRCGY